MSELHDEEEELRESSAEERKERIDKIKNTYNTGKKIGKKVGKKIASKYKKVAEFAAKIISKLGPALPWIALGLLILIAIIGILGFLMTMPGLLTGKLKQIAQDVVDTIQTIGTTVADAKTNKGQILETAEYIRSMGYDLIGYGFIPANDSLGTVGEDGHLVDADGNKIEKSGHNFDKYGISYSISGDEVGAKGTFEEAGTIVDYLDGVDESILRTYAISDLRLFTVRNYDDKINSFFGNIKSSWSSGLISLYKAKNFLATSSYSMAEAGSITVDPHAKKMTIQKGWFNNPMIFSLDGWSGRYGLSLEFLLSLHLATMAPELVTTMARSFDTEVQVYLDEVDGAQVEGYFKTDSGEYITKQTIKDIDTGVADDSGIDIPGWINKKDAYYIMTECGINSKEIGHFACLNGAKIQIIARNGLCEEGHDYNTLISKSNTTGALKDIIVTLKDGTNYPQSDWESFFKNNSGKYKGVKASEDDYGTLEHFAYCFNHALRSITITDDSGSYNTKVWKDEDGHYGSAVYDKHKIWLDPETLKLLWYYDEGGNFEEKLDQYIPFPDVNNIVAGEAVEFEVMSIYENPNDLYNSKVARVSIIIRRTTLDKNLDFDVISYIEPSPAQISAERTDEDLCHNRTDTTTVCSNCEKYVETIRDALDDIRDDDYNTYIPYIARVIDSWFRDTYFVVPEDGAAGSNDDSDSDGSAFDQAIDDAYSHRQGLYGEDAGERKLTGNAIEYVLVDDEYLKETDENWTKYEKNDDGTYKLYRLESDGTVGSEYTGTVEEAKQQGIELVKKAETAKIEDNSDKENIVWTAYASGVTSAESDKILLEVNDETENKNMKEVAKNYETEEYDDVFYYSVTNMPEITQQHDGRRGITNSKIKKMFKVRKYYIYDGTSERAEKIYKDWQNVVNNSFGGDENAANLAIDNYYYNDVGSDPRNPDLIGNITINKDTLDAFAILENTNTLDADYQYRDFKELIVELNYFDKEDLSDKAEEVFTWILPGCKEVWPVRLIDKSEEYYGTYVHSAKAIEQLKKDNGIEVSEDGEETVVPEAETEEKQENLKQLAQATGYEIGGENGKVISPVTGKIIGTGTYERVNTDLINKGYKEEDAKETVSYIQIQVLSEEDKAAWESSSYEKEFEGYYEEYKDVCDGYIVTIDGIKVGYKDERILDEDFIKASVPNLVDDDKEEELEKLELAKAAIPAFIDIGKGKYVTEGAVIGETTETSSTYSYMRIIVRDHKRAMVENVEDYFELPMEMTLKGEKYTGSLPEEASNWLAVTLEGMPAAEGGYFTAIDIEDGTITIGPGVTNYCENIAKELGYDEYFPMKEGDKVPESVVMDIYNAKVAQDCEAIEKQFEGITFSQTEVTALLALKYQAGHIPNDIKQEVIRYKKGETNNLKSVWTGFINVGPKHEAGIRNRRNAEYELFVNGNYTKNGKT